MSTDPFIIVKEDVEQAMEQAGEIMAQWEKKRRARGSQGVQQLGSELVYLKEEFSQIYDSVKQDLIDLQSTIEVAKKQPEKYGLNKQSLKQREKFVSGTRDKLESYMERMRIFDDKSQRIEIQNQDTRESITRYGYNNENGDQVGVMQHQLIMEQQDQQLDSVMGTVRNLRGIAQVMNVELGDHNELLGEMDGLVDNAQERIRRARSKVGEFLNRSSENHPLKMIGILLVLIIVLIMLILV